MKVHAFGSEPHYRDHIRAVWARLPEEIRGIEFTKPSAIPMADSDDVFMLAGYNDFEHVPNHRIIYVEHGAGQSYVGIKPQYALRYGGAVHPNRVVAYISPRQELADSWGRPAFAAGSPICDPYQLFGEEGVVAFTFHYDAPQICPELRTAFWHYAERMPDIIAALRRGGYEVLGHRHPRFTHLSTAWENWGVPEVDADTVRSRASIVVADNTSLLYEAMYLNRRPVALDAPWYRRSIEHGLRFWEYRPSTHFADPEALLSSIRRFGEHWADVGNETQDCSTAHHVYGRSFSDGNDGERAASWLTAFLAGL